MTTPLKILVTTLTLIAALYLLACALLAYNARSLLYHPVPRTADVPYWEMPRDDAQLLISSNKGPSRQQRVLYFGGNAEDVSQAVPMLEQAFPDATVHAMHYRGYGGSGSSPTEARLIADALALYDATAGGATDITVIGRSLGSGVAIQLAAARPVQRLVLITPYDSIGDLAARMFPIFPVRLLLRDHYDSRRYVAGIKAPTTLIIAGRDEVIPNASSLRLLQRFPSGVAQAVTIADADHNDVSAYPQFAQALRGR